MNASRQEKRLVRVVMASEYEFEVMDEKYKTFVVNLQNRTCDCGACHICGIPCKHVTRCIARRQEDVVDYVDWKLTVEAYLATYSDVMHPLLDQITWSIIEGLKILSPKVKVKVGRPKTMRRKEPGEQ